MKQYAPKARQWVTARQSNTPARREGRDVIREEMKGEELTTETFDLDVLERARLKRGTVRL